jgi:hypothetical protein
MQYYNIARRSWVDNRRDDLSRSAGARCKVETDVRVRREPEHSVVGAVQIPEVNSPV